MRVEVAVLGCPKSNVQSSFLVSVDVKLCFSIGLSLSLICQLTSKDIKQHNCTVFTHNHLSMDASYAWLGLSWAPDTVFTHICPSMDASHAWLGISWAPDTVFAHNHPSMDASHAWLDFMAECGLHSIAHHLMSFWKSEISESRRFSSIRVDR